MDHIGDDHGGHSHGHGEPGHSHGLSDYYLEQLLTVFVCGAMGLTAVLMFAFGRLDVILISALRPWVLAGGVALLAVTAVRGFSLWRSVGAAGGDAGAGHVHGPDCDHDHGPEDHAHMPGGIYLKTIPLMVPLLLFVMGLPSSAGFSQENINSRLGTAVTLGEVRDVAAKSGDVLALEFSDLNMSAYDPGKREAFEGRRVRVEGQVKKVSEKDYELFTMKMTCCAADTIPLKARIKSEIVIPQSQFPDHQWVSVEGLLQFVEIPAKNMYLPVIRIGGKGGLGLQKIAAK